MGTISVKPPITRKPGIYPAGRSCQDCGARLSRNNPALICAPCNNGEWREGEGGATDRQVLELRRARLEDIGAAA